MTTQRSCPEFSLLLLSWKYKHENKQEKHHTNVLIHHLKPVIGKHFIHYLSIILSTDEGKQREGENMIQERKRLTHYIFIILQSHPFSGAKHCQTHSIHHSGSNSPLFKRTIVFYLSMAHAGTGRATSGGKQKEINDTAKLYDWRYGLSLHCMDLCHDVLNFLTLLFSAELFLRRACAWLTSVMQHWVPDCVVSCWGTSLCNQFCWKAGH